MPTTDRTTPSAGRTGQLDRLLLILGVLLFCTAAVVSRTPLTTLNPPSREVIDMTAARPNGGNAWVLSHDLGVESDKAGGHSSVELFEGDAPLSGGASHQAMRDGKLGAFSHWGTDIYLSTTDGSDPRSNGRVYMALVPGSLPPDLAQMVSTALAGALGLAALGLVLGIVRRRRLLSHALPAVAVLVAAAWWMTEGSPDWPSLGAIRSASQDLAGAADARLAHAATRPGNVRRLLDDDATIVFEAEGELSLDDDTRRVTVTAEAGVETKQGMALLVPGGPGWVAELSPPSTVGEIAQVLLPIHVASGETLIVEFFSADRPDRSKIEIEVPVTPSDGVRPLKIVQPLSFWVDRLTLPLTRVRVRVPRTATDSLTARLDEVVLIGPAEAYRHSTHGFDRLSVEHDLRPARWQSVPGRFVIPVGRNDGRLLKGAVTTVGRRPDGPVAFRIKSRAPGRSETLLLEGSWTPEDTWVDQRLELPPHAEASEVILEVPSLPAGTALAWAGWRLVDTRRAPKRVVLLLLDTLRADALGCYGAATRTPTIDALAQRGVRFENCYSQAYWTRPSMPSIMTGHYVAGTGVQAIGQTLPPSYVTLAEAFSEAGFLTVADIANTNAGPASGLDQGWDRLQLFGPASQKRTEDQVREHVEPSLADCAEEDLLLYVHVMEPHGPYGPHEAPAQLPEFPDATPVDRDPTLDRSWVTTPTDASRRHWYAADVASTDDGLRVLFDVLAENWGEGLRDATVALASDHGEYLGEYGRWSHGWFKLLPEVTHVPLIISSPNEALSGLVSTTFVENIDLAPTLLELAGADPSALTDARGHSLAPLMRGETSEHHAVSMTAVTENGTEQLSLYAENVALIGQDLTISAQLDGLGRMTDRANSDDAALVELTVSDWVESSFADLWTRYLDVNAATREHLWADVDTSSTTIDPEALQQLEALGYLGR